MKEVTLDSVDWLKQSIKEAQSHLGASLMDKFVFNKNLLEPSELAEVEEHIVSCDRCRTEAEDVSRRKEVYLNSPSFG